MAQRKKEKNEKSLFILCDDVDDGDDDDLTLDLRCMPAI